MANKWWETHCPVCGEAETVTAQEEMIRYCTDCKFQWSMELEEYMVIILARNHLTQKKAQNGSTNTG